MPYRLIKNMRLKKNKGGAGFTLVEILVGISIIITTSIIVVAILVSTFRTSSKTTSGDTVRQNGNYAITQFSKMIQFADSLGPDQACPLTSASDQSLIIMSSGVSRTLSCTNLSLDNQPLIDTNKVRIVTCSFTCTRSSAVDTPVIGINFSLKSQGTSLVTSNLPERNTVINFKTSIKMKNQ